MYLLALAVGKYAKKNCLNEEDMNVGNVHRLFVLSVGLFLLFISSCATMKKSAFQNTIDDNSAEDYILGPDDAIKISVERHPEWNGEYTIRPSGNILIPSIGELKLAHLTKRSAESACKELFGQFINNPQVTIDITRYSSEVIYVLGEVNLPGKYSTGGKNITVRDAIVLAALPSRFAATKRVYVISSSNSRPVQHVVNLYRILYRGETKYNITVKPGDIVYVPKTLWGYLITFISDLISPLQAVPMARQAALPTTVQAQ